MTGHFTSYENRTDHELATHGDVTLAMTKRYGKIPGVDRADICHC